MAKEREKPELRHEPTIYEAELQSGASGAVLRGQELDKDAAVSRRVDNLAAQGGPLDGII